MVHASPDLIEQTRRNIAEIVTPAPTQEELFWMRFRVGECYLMRMPITPEVLDELLRDRAFWNWVQQIWFLNDLKIVKMCAAGGERWNQDDYEYCQGNLFKSYKINRVILASARPPAVANTAQGHEQNRRE